jgi:hypothetical protein
MGATSPGSCGVLELDCVKGALDAGPSSLLPNTPRATSNSLAVPRLHDGRRFFHYIAD